MNIAMNGFALQFLLPTALLIPLCAWAGYQIASDAKRRRVMVALIFLFVLMGCLWTSWAQFGLAFSPGHQDATYYNTFYGLQVLLAPIVAMCASAFGYWTRRSALYGGAGLVTLSTALPALWWGASRTNAALVTPLVGHLLVIGLGTLAGALATLLPEVPPINRVRRLVLWTTAGAVGAVGGLLLGIVLAGSPLEPPRVAADTVLPTVLMITVLTIMALIPALILAARGSLKPSRLLPPAVGVALAVAACWVALSDLPALNQTAVSAPLEVRASRMLSLPEGPPPRPSASALGFSPDGRWLAVGLAPEAIHPEYLGGIVVWRTSDWSVAANVEPSAGAMWPIWSPDGQHLILVTGSGEVRVLTTQDWTGVRSWSRPDSLKGGAITPDGLTLWLAETSALTAWNMQDGTPSGQIPLDEQPTSPPVIAPDASWIAIAGGAVVSVWHLPAGTPWQQLPGHARHAIHLSASPDSATLAVGSWDAVARIWRIEDGVLLAAIPDGGEKVEFSPDGAYMAGASFRGISAIYQAGLWERRVVLQSGGMSDKATVLAYSPDGGRLVGAGQSPKMPLWTLPTLRALPSAPTGERPTTTAAPTGSLQWITADNASHLGQVGVLHQDGLAAVFLPLSNTLALASGEVRLFPDPLLSTRPARRWATGDNGYLLAASPDGRLVATRGDTTHELDVWRAADGERVAHLTGSSDNLLTAAFSPDSTALAAAGEEGIVFTWAVDGGKLQQQWPAGMIRVSSLIFSPDGSTIWVGGDGADGLRLIRATDGTLVRAFPATDAGIAAIALAPDGRTLAVISDSSDVQLWGTAEGIPLGRLADPYGGLKTLAWSPDGALLAAGGGSQTVTVWDASSGKILAALTGHTEGVNTVLFAPDGQLLVSVGGDSTVRFWGVYGP